MTQQKKILITGSQGFIGSYLCQELLSNNYSVYGVDNYSKYGKIKRPQDAHKNFSFSELDVLDTKFNTYIQTVQPNYIIACAAMIGGIAYFHKYAYDLLATNERILANTFDSAINCLSINKIIVLSSSMVYESTKDFPSKETDIQTIPPPISTYGFQKLSSEYFCKGAYEQYGLKYNIVRPFNCVGVGEDESLKDDIILTNKTHITMSHVIPDLINKILVGQNPLHILGDGNQVRCYTNGKDIARGIRLVVESKYDNEDFNISSTEQISVLDLAKIIWEKLRPNISFKFISTTPFINDVQFRLPDVKKAKELLNFETTISLNDSIEEVIQYIQKKGNINDI